MQKPWAVTVSPVTASEVIWCTCSLRCQFAFCVCSGQFRPQLAGGQGKTKWLSYNCHPPFLQHCAQGSSCRHMRFVFAFTFPCPCWRDVGLIALQSCILTKSKVFLIFFIHKLKVGFLIRWYLNQNDNTQYKSQALRASFTHSFSHQQ